MNNEERLKISNLKLDAIDNFLSEYIKIIVSKLTRKLLFLKSACEECNIPKNIDDTFKISSFFNEVNEFENVLNNLIEII